ncbi:MAG: hypothetical protein BWY83_00023 [bacterium ADurb.Bin478]|nr:MAG: hypothetical protein BWY83_00023 [bacterium ADurb.Bin478]
MKKQSINVICLTGWLLLLALIHCAGPHQRILRPGTAADGKSITLPDTWLISPTGRSLPLPGDMAMRIIVGPDGGRAFVNTAGWHNHSINLIDLTTEK